MDRETIARERRRAQAQEQLEEQRELETTLRDELAERISEADGPHLDEQVFAQMDPAEAKLVRDGFAGVSEEEAPPDEASFWGDDESWTEPDEDPAVELEDEIARLERELEVCRARQQAYERYLELLG